MYASTHQIREPVPLVDNWLVEVGPYGSAPGSRTTAAFTASSLT